MTYCRYRTGEFVIRSSTACDIANLFTFFAFKERIYARCTHKPLKSWDKRKKTPVCTDLGLLLLSGALTLRYTNEAECEHTHQN